MFSLFFIKKWAFFSFREGGYLKSLYTVPKCIDIIKSAYKLFLEYALVLTFKFVFFRIPLILLLVCKDELQKLQVW